MSKLRISVRFANVLKAMGGDKIAREILHNTNSEMTLVNNYVDITNSKDSLSFTPDRKANELLENIPTHFIVHTHGNLLFKSSNKKIFDILEFDMTAPTAFQIPTGTIGDILKEYISETSGKTYCLFKENGTERLGVINKSSLRPHNDIFYKYTSSDQYYEDDLGSISPWYDATDVHVDTINTSRNNIKIGRLVRTLLKSEIKDSDIEKFVNSYKSTYDVLSNAFNKFSIVEGEDIIHWYNKENYLEGGGTLNSSCMAEVAKTYFNIYVKNTNVKMVILYDDNGKVNDDVYKSKKIKGRAILWTCEIDGEATTFMDRVYTRFDSDTNLFKEFAKKNGWWFKENQDMESNGYVTDGTQRKRPTIKVYLEKSKTGKLPYMDTLCFIDAKNKFCTNKSDLCDDDHRRTARTTHGGWYEND
jgi:hypothetical protein